MRGYQAPDPRLWDVVGAEAPAILGAYQQTAKCRDHGDYPALAGRCPNPAHKRPPLSRLASIARMAASSPEAVGALLPDICKWYTSTCLFNVDNGKPPRSIYGFGYTTYIGMCNHIPVADGDSLEKLDNYFLGKLAEKPQGSTHGATARAVFVWKQFGSKQFPFAESHIYVPPNPGGPAPWAQGKIRRGTACGVPFGKLASQMSSGEPNEALISWENQALTGSQGVTDAQFNANVTMRAHYSVIYGFPITPDTQTWHAEFDQVDRCFDPGWTGTLEDAMQDAARAIAAGRPPEDVLRGGKAAPIPVPPVPPPPPPEPVDKLSGLLRGIALKVLTGDRDSLMAAHRDLTRLLVPTNNA